MFIETPNCRKCITFEKCGCFFSFQQDDSRIETEERDYEVSKSAIRDKSMLSFQAQKLCENIDAYWMTFVCNAPDDSKQRKSLQPLQSVCQEVIIVEGVEIKRWGV